MSLLLQRVECMKEYSRLAGLAEEREARGEWRQVAALWERAAEAGRQVNHGDKAIARLAACRRRIENQENDD
ncbi:hypothetical protein SGGMMB4_05906 (plasmid) [Sodalis glossinidius str. 'morsitans']|uniref:PerC transcriptional activator n=1 Tax=Sodalis glossinidius (strain morsitans) TaxID=343509 RepID=Q2NPZ1_SODGM|nr:hypothetical protein [Sodalis glossinidius]BAE75784.1 hypothetical protein SGP2_0023 [Sodalis glossinidius str. 'morsitans']CRL46934.1 hypothetical protein SGGMMB4_05906 [Sodalis glossinidius str. 'morsitans']